VPASGEGGLVSAAAGVGQAHDGLGDADRSDSVLIGQAGCEVVEECLELSAVVFQLPFRRAQSNREAPDFSLTDRLGAGGVAR
jgi:hypothetical protein